MNHKKIILNILPILILITILLAGLAAEEPHILWEKTYGGTGDNRGYDCCTTSDGGFIIAGYTACLDTEGYDVYLIKTDENGDTVWTRTYSNKKEDTGYSVCQTSDGGFAVAGETGTYPELDILLLRTDEDGELLWKKTFGGAEDDVAYAIEALPDGNVLLAGRCPVDGGHYDVYLAKIDSKGELLWDKTFGNEKRDIARAVKATKDGGIIIVGETQTADDASDILFIKATGSGKELWSKSFDARDFDMGTDVIETNDGGFLITGYAFSLEKGEADIYLVRTDQSGELLWERTYGGSGEDRSFAVYERADRTIIVAGYRTFAQDAGGTDIYLIEADAKGDTLRTWALGLGDSHDEARWVVATPSGELIVSGFAVPPERSDTDVFLLKLK